MANSSRIPLVLVVVLAVAVCAAAIGGKVGGRRQVKNVKDNKEVQELGRYCVGEFNRRLQERTNASTTKLLVFSHVVEAETQVVSGIKYYLTISAATCDAAGPPMTFRAVVVVKAWLHSKILLDFAPSDDQPPTSTK
ncbi:hypothetical protein C2S53_019264 [Perilla frutescens var. hirtella]|uniref:Cystatin domain-containing protein n=1 Tax=Perilla frutescens var. hirtella TaxID=608512 RepID=A0AAD4IV86_PERFH|nr:hypothetical protein C2S51_021086 [Perilla frutescens var. frutescens]KAH6821956.1 hypothetical protein C2S53_019264 [Perilla frutescens var. hirtella]